MAAKGELPGFGPRAGGWDRNPQILFRCEKGHRRLCPDRQERLCMNWSMSGLCTLPLEEVEQ